MSHFTGITRSFLGALVLSSHFGALLTIDMHSLPVPESTPPLISYQNETLYLLYVIPVQNVVRPTWKLEFMLKRKAYIYLLVPRSVKFTIFKHVYYMYVRCFTFCTTGYM